jgi:hypothetical protein
MARTHVIMMMLSLVVACSTASINSVLRDELLEMGRRDQEVRERMIPLLKAATPGEPFTGELKAVVDEQTEIDQANTQRIVEIIDEFGWPGPDLVGPEASGAVQIMLQHADLESLQRLLPDFRQAVANGQASRSQLAMVEDQIRVEQGLEQTYGTEVVTGPDGVTRVYPIEDPEHVDERRAAIGLQPLEDYLTEMEQGIGIKIQR